MVNLCSAKVELSIFVVQWLILFTFAWGLAPDGTHATFASVVGEGDLGSPLRVAGEGDLGTTARVAGEGDLGSTARVAGENDLGSTVRVAREGDLGSTGRVVGEGDPGSTSRVGGESNTSLTLHPATGSMGSKFTCGESVRSLLTGTFCLRYKIIWIPLSLELRSFTRRLS